MPSKEMLDYIKLYIFNADIDRLLGDDRLDFKCEISKSTGEIGKWLVADYFHCKISIYQQPGEEKIHVIFAGSIHKMWNALVGVVSPNFSESRKYTGFNGNDFSYDEALLSLIHISDIFRCRLCDMIFENIEFGFNIITAFIPNLFVQGLLMHNGILFELTHNRNCAQAKHQRYIFKIYNKSILYGMKNNILRVELKYQKMIDLNANGLCTAADINPKNIRWLKDVLVKKIDEILYYDFSINKTGLKAVDKNALLRYSNSFYWIDLASSQRDRPKKKLNEYIIKYSKDLRSQITCSIQKKFLIITPELLKVA